MIFGIWAKDGLTRFFSQRYIVTSETLSLRESWRLVSFKSSLRTLIQSPHVLQISGYFSPEIGFLAFKVKWQKGNTRVRGGLPRGAGRDGGVHGESAQPILREDLGTAAGQD